MSGARPLDSTAVCVLSAAVMIPLAFSATMPETSSYVARSRMSHTKLR